MNKIQFHIDIFDVQNDNFANVGYMSYKSFLMLFEYLFDDINIISLLYEYMNKFTILNINNFNFGVILTSSEHDFFM